ncbi:uroporphyrinogen-III C-methyltransferase [Alteribacillus bidgolensis]|uniref:Uroporphyrinogen-III C-methyltransferase n=1 Tax=Alteribacillus bidgolensis TaxID=930129 RepID=A0A1G8L7Q0_9BACI|nr:uroporphyrinogen-III C-methyltransferase [Alteribacillus bidgolensis]SDI51641.1 uroporphyrinogen-III C-methyltransferase [Alteribacillus bidgolensis]
MKEGKVYLVGAGPGDAGLITIKGEECLKNADVILYDRLVNPLLLEKAKESADRIYCGKLPDRHHLRQDAIQQLMVEKAREGLDVVRLKGGDPGIFGRSGEEAAALKEAGIVYEVVPGITSGIAAPLYAGIPVTHRNISGSFAAVTGHSNSENGQPSPNWKALAKAVDTIAFYMGVKNLPAITEKLIYFGKPEHTPVLIIEWGTTGRQRVIDGTLADISEKAKMEQVQNPAITLVGEVAALRENLSWFEHKALHGRYVWVVKTSPQPGKIAKTLINNGAEVLEAPRFIEEDSNTPIPDDLAHFDSLVFHSDDSVSLFFETLRKQKIDIRRLPERVYARSKRTKKKLEQHGIFPFLEEAPADDKSLLIGKKEDLPSDNDHKVDWISHALKVSPQTRKTTARIVNDNLINTIVLPCAKAVDTLLTELDVLGVSAVEWVNNKTIICYGPQTKEAAQAAGLNVYCTLSKPENEELLHSFSALKR